MTRQSRRTRQDPARDPTISHPGDREQAAETFERERPYLLSVAYRLTGSWADAEDAVAHAWPRWADASGQVQHPRAWLTRVVSRQALDGLRSARARRERYVGPWLPEPLVTGWSSEARTAGALGTSAAAQDPLEIVVQDESVRMAFLVVLDTLTPEQRVAFVLHDVLDLPFREVAGVLGCEEAAARQHASRARRRVADADPAPRVPPAEAEDVVRRLSVALAEGDVTAVAGLLAPDVVLLGDGGGVVSATRRPVRGADRVARLLLGLVRLGGEGLTVEPVRINGDPGFRMRMATRRRAHHADRGVYTLAVRDGRVAAVYGVLAPDKLTAAGFGPPEPAAARPRSPASTPPPS